jgi:uncharacterized protein (TIGR00369 family)
MKTLNPDWVKTITQTINTCPYFQLQSMKILDLSWGTSRIEIDLAEKHLQPFGIVHGGVFASLLDAAGWWASYTQVNEDLGMTTVECKINYLAPMISGKLVGLGRSIKQGNTIQLSDARLEDENGKLVAHGTVTSMALANLHIAGQGNLPPKFLG